MPPEDALRHSFGYALAVGFIYLDSDCAPSEVFGCAQSCPATRKRVEYHLAGRCFDCLERKLERERRRMRRAGFLRDIPHIARTTRCLVAQPEVRLGEDHHPFMRWQVEGRREVHTTCTRPHHDLTQGQSWIVCQRSNRYSV